MLPKLLKIVFIAVCAVFFGYLMLPNFNFPKAPPDSLQSNEPGDSESPLRRAYFTDYTREEVMSWYKNQFDRSSFFAVRLPTYRLNYPPEDAQGIIRDQTRSTFLEEIVHPFRESIYVNGFEPKDPKDAVIIEGRHFRQKIIVRFVPSSPVVRIVVFAGIIFFAAILYGEWKKSLRKYV